METTKHYLDKKRIAYTIAADGLIYVDGDITIAQDESAQLECLAEISGTLIVRQGAKLTAPALTTIGGYLYVYEGAKLTVPALTRVVTIYVYEGAKLTAPALTRVGGYLYVREGAKLTVPALTSVGGHLYVCEGAKLTVPALTSVGGHLYVREGAKLTVPALTSVGHVAYETTIFGHKVEVYDGMGCVLVSEKSRDGYTLRSCRKAAFKDGALVGEKYFVVSQGEHNAHGETLEDAMADLMFKTADRDVSKYRNMPADTTKTPHEWAVIYRIVTGACQLGTAAFIAQKGTLKPEYTLAEIVAETRGAYASERFRAVVGVA